MFQALIGTKTWLKRKKSHLTENQVVVEKVPRMFGQVPPILVLLVPIVLQKTIPNNEMLMGMMRAVQNVPERIPF